MTKHYTHKPTGQTVIITGQADLTAEQIAAGWNKLVEVESKDGFAHTGAKPPYRIGVSDRIWVLESDLDPAPGMIWEA